MLRCKERLTWNHGEMFEQAQTTGTVRDPAQLLLWHSVTIAGSSYGSY